MSRNSFGIKYVHCEQWGEGVDAIATKIGAKK
jgi:hypothetical protein